ncbi:MAG TPA: DUF4388 domain-containing protein [Candidatus Acidoferrum sp.]|nr:DUF4388 domain-containing protein [Candidatus Acidoferrum sp.]
MNAYLVAFAILAGIGVYLTICAVKGGGRPRTAEELLGGATPANPAKTSSDLRSLIELNVLAKATGILTVTSGGQNCAICFLFGHVFHAACGSVTGEDAIRMAMQWPSPDLNFNPKAQLPLAETITRPIPDILNAA